MMSNSSKVTRNLRVLCLIFAITSIKQSTDAASFAGCDHKYYIKPGYSYLKSPDHPYSYPPGTSCRYKFIAPLDHEIVVDCTIGLSKGETGCSTEYFYFARDGDQYLRDSERFCGAGRITRKSAFRSVVLAYVSGGSTGSFQCQLLVQPQPCDCGWSVNTKISNGEEASVNEYPSMVALHYYRNRSPLFYCAGSIISHRYIVTAAHCANAHRDTNNIKAWVGDHNIQSRRDTKYAAVYNIDTIIIHPDYTPDPTNNDIALMRTATDIEFSKGVGPICLPPLSNANNAFTYESADVIGWGTTKFGGHLSPTLQKVTLLIMDNQACRAVHQDVNQNKICTLDQKGTGQDSCQFDSGGPVILKPNRQFLIGIISDGLPCGVTLHDVGINTRVTSFLKWIHQFTGDSTCAVNM